MGWSDKVRNKKMLRQRRLSGFTIIELMITVVIIAVLALIAYPNYQAHVIKARRSDATAALQGFANALERHYTINSSYLGAGTLNTNNDGPPAVTVYPSQTPIDGNTKFYQLTIRNSTVGAPPDTTADTFVIRATPIAGTSQDGDGYIELTHLNQRRWDRDNSGLISAAENTWGL